MIDIDAMQFHLKIMVIIFFLFVICLGFTGCLIPNECQSVAEEFVGYVIEGSAQAQALSLGTVKNNLARSNIPKCDVVSIETEVLSNSKNHSTVLVTSQSKKDSVINLGWYKLSMIKTDDQWKVYRVQEAEPVIVPGVISGVDEALIILGKYIETSVVNYEQAAHLLAGKARASHLYMEDVFRSQLSAMKIGDIDNIEPIIGNEKALLVQISYRVDNRNLSALVSFYKSREGWMIYDITQI